MERRQIGRAYYLLYITAVCCWFALTTSLLRVIITFRIAFWSVKRFRIASRFMWKNYKQALFVSELWAPLELLPNISNLDNHYRLTCGAIVRQDIRNTWNEVPNFIGRFLLVCCIPAFVLFAFLPVVAFRISMKSTCIVWLGSAWLSPFSKSGPLPNPLHDREQQILAVYFKVIRGPSAVISLLLSVVVAVLFSMKLALCAIDARMQVPGPLGQYFDNVIALDSIPPWHVSAFAASVLTLAWAFRALKIRDAVAGGLVWSAVALEREYVQYRFWICACAGYSILCKLIIFLIFVARIPIPKWGPLVPGL